MKKLSIISLTVVALLPLSAQAKTIYGYQAWESGVEHAWRGPVSFDSANPSDMKRIADYSDMSVVYSGYYYNYHWYGQAIVKGTQSSVEGLYEIDMNTGERTLMVKGGTKMVDLTYDYYRNKVWGIRNGNSFLCEYLPATGSYNSHGIFKCGNEEVYMLALASALDGTLYAVGSNDNLYTVDVDNAACTLVGALGVDAGFDQTMGFDYQSGILYWCNNGDYTLYTIDTSTGLATRVGPMGPDGISSMASLFVPYINVAVGAPDRVVDITGKGGANSIEISWTNPSITAQGEPLTQLDGVHILRDGQQLADVTLATDIIGKLSTYVDNDVEPGKDYSYQIVPFNNAGDGGVDADLLTVRAGNDVPGAVGNFSALSGDGSAILSWTAPTAGAGNGVFDAAGITGYVVQRNNRTIATIGKDELRYEDKTTFGTYSYSVAAVNDQGTGVFTTIENVQVKPADWIIMRNGNETLADGVEYKFYDEGGPQDNYKNSSNYELVLSPSNPNGVVVMQFSKLAIDTYYDNIAIYHGSGTGGDMVGSFNGTSVPMELENIESKADDGCLTVTFASDIMDVAAGWEATVKVNLLKGVDLAVVSLAIPPQAVTNAETTGVVTVKNGGTQVARNYTLQLLSGDEILAEIKGPEIASRSVINVDIPYKPIAEGTCSIHAKVIIDGDEDSSNDESAPATQKVLPVGTNFVELLTPAENQSKIAVVPASFLGFESLSEILYHQEAIPEAVGNEILTITYPMLECSKSYKDVPFVMYMGTTKATDMATTIPARDLTKVYEGAVTFTAGDSQLSFVLDTPFKYDADNLVVMLHKLESPTDNGGVNFRGCYGYSNVCDGSHANCTLFTSRWDADSEPIDPNASSIGYSAQNMRPDIILAVKSDVEGVDNIAIDGDGNTNAIYYNLQGVCVSADRLTPGVYIRLQNGHSTKVLIK